MCEITDTNELNNYMTSSNKEVVTFPGNTSLLINDIDLGMSCIEAIESLFASNARRLHLCKLRPAS